MGVLLNTNNSKCKIMMVFDLSNKSVLVWWWYHGKFRRVETENKCKEKVDWWIIFEENGGDGKGSEARWKGW